ncbi:hypothetical protein BGW80DRAFT_1277948 [Lactifluus volemus]|nr:hypothetical protein BGW80DRAFT_1277948 [Lactifluus volemus]
MWPTFSHLPCAVNGVVIGNCLISGLIAVVRVLSHSSCMPNFVLGSQDQVRPLRAYRFPVMRAHLSFPTRSLSLHRVPRPTRSLRVCMLLFLKPFPFFVSDPPQCCVGSSSITYSPIYLIALVLIAMSFSLPSLNLIFMLSLSRCWGMSTLRRCGAFAVQWTPVSNNQSKASATPLTWMKRGMEEQPSWILSFIFIYLQFTNLCVISSKEVSYDTMS